MKGLKNVLLLSALLFSGLLLLSCSKTGKGSGPLETLRGFENTDFKKAYAGQQDNSVKIVPENPDVNSDLHAVFTGSANALNYSWFLNDEPVEGANGDVLGKGNFKKGDKVGVTVTGEGIKSSFIVVIGNSAPVVTGVKLLPKYIYRGVDITAEAEGTDPNGEPVSFDYQWILNGEEAVTQTAPVLKGDQFKRGDNVTVRVTPRDGFVPGAPFTPPPIIIPNAPPGFVSTPPKESASQIYLYEVKTADPDGDAINYALSKAPEGMKISSYGKIEWTIKKEDRGTHEVVITADDGNGGKATQEFTINVSVN